MRFLLSVGFSLVLLGVVGSGQEKTQAKRFCFISAKDLLDASAPNFDKYAVKLSPPLSPAQLDVQSNPIAKTYRTVIRQQMRKGANFADHYRVVVWGCGTSCAQFAVVNLSTGRVITAAGIRNVSGVHFAADDFLPNTESEGGGFRFREDSRLLVLLGAMNEDDSKEGVFYYALNDDKLQLLHKTLATHQTCEDHDQIE